MKTLMTAATVAWLVASPRPAAAQSWPDFPLRSVAGGETLASRTLVADGASAVVVVRPSCAPCRDVLRRLTIEVGNGRIPPTRVFVVVSGGSAADVTAFKAAAPGLLPTAWYADDAGRAVDLLHANAVPLVIGVKRGEVGWTLRGSQFTDAFVHDVVLPWFR